MTELQKSLLKLALTPFGILAFYFDWQAAGIMFLCWWVSNFIEARL